MTTYSKAGLMAVAFASLVPFTALAGGKKAADPIALSVSSASQDLNWSINQAWNSATLKISNPNIEPFALEFDVDQPITFGILGADGIKLPDGIYKWELQVNTSELQTRAETTPDAGFSTNTQGLSAFGTVSIVNGVFLVPKSTGVDSDTPIALKDQVFFDDVIINQSLAVGQDAVNGESFGFDTLRLKENNLRIHFQDTSNSASFPTRDWRIIINDSSNGGSNFFAIEDSDLGTKPFLVESGAGNNALYVDEGGEVGFGTNAPLVELHAVDGNTPTLRLEQNGSSGFTAQTWDVGSNESNFFVRDTTHSSRIPFKIKPSAPTNSLFVNTNGDIGLGTQTPDAHLDLEGTSPSILFTNTTPSALHWSVGSTSTGLYVYDKTNDVIPFRIQNTAPADSLFVDADGDIGLGTQTPDSRLDIEDTTPAMRLTNTTANSTWDLSTNAAGVGVASTSTSGTVLELSGAMDPALVMRDRSEGVAWSMVVKGGDETFDVINPEGDVAWSMTTEGDLTILGSLTAGSTTYPSDFNIKNNIIPVDSQEILKRVTEMPISTWSYNSDKKGLRHMGPMAQDFKAAFNLGDKDTTINVVDAGGVALAAIQGMDLVIKEKDAEISELKEKSERMEQQLELLMKEVQSMKSKN